MVESKNKNFGFNGRIRGLGVTFYRRGGEDVCPHRHTLDIEQTVARAVQGAREDAAQHCIVEKF